MKRHKNSQLLQSSGIVLGSICAMIVTAMVSMVIAYLVVGQTIGEGRIAIAAIGITFVAALVGCLISGISSGASLMLTNLITAGIYGLILLIMGMFMDGAFDGILICIGSLLCASMVSYIICRKRQGKKITAKRHSR